MVEGAGLENRYTLLGYRGFESRPLRHFLHRTSARKTAVSYRSQVGSGQIHARHLLPQSGLNRSDISVLDRADYDRLIVPLQSVVIKDDTPRPAQQTSRRPFIP